MSLLFRRTNTLFFLGILLFLIGAMIRVSAIGAIGLWGDEYHLVRFSTQKSLADFFNDYIRGRNDSQPLYYLVSFLFFRIMPLSIFSVRLPALLFGLTSIPVLYFLGKRLFGEKIAFSCISLLSFNFFHIRHSLEARPYSLFILLSIVSIYYFFKLTVNWHSSSDRIKLCITNILMHFTHPFAIFFILLQYITLFMKNLPLSKKVTKNRSSLMNAVSCSFIPELLVFPILFLLRIKVFMRHGGIAEDSFLYALFNLYREYLQYSYVQKINSFIFSILLLCFIFNILSRNQSLGKLIFFLKVHRWLIWFLMLTVFSIPSILYLVPNIKVFYIPRLFAFILAPLLLIISFALESLQKTLKYSFLFMVIVFSINGVFHRLDFNRPSDLGYGLLFDRLRALDKKIVYLEVNAAGMITFFSSQNKHIYSNVMTKEMFCDNFQKLDFENKYSDYNFIYHLSDMENILNGEVFKKLLPNTKWTFIDVDDYLGLQGFVIKKVILK